MDNRFVPLRGLQSAEESGYHFSDIGKALTKQMDALKNPPSPGSLQTSNGKETLEESLFEATANAKILTSQIAMHIGREWRDRLFQQLDSLHDPAEWDCEDLPIQKASFATFLKAVFQLAPRVRPGLGLSYQGHLLAAWVREADRLTIEFLPNDRVQWIMSKYVGGEVERFAGEVGVSRLAESLDPYEPQRWLS